MPVKEIGILMVFCLGFLNTPLEATIQERPAKVSASSDPNLSKSKPVDTPNYGNIIDVKKIKYTQDIQFNRFAEITIRNTSKGVISALSFNLKGSVGKGERNCYEIKRETKLQPNQSLNISQRLNTGDFEAHTIENLKVKYTMEISFTLD
jgi:hypothetical protein